MVKTVENKCQYTPMHVCTNTLVESVESVKTVKNTCKYSPQKWFLWDEEIRALLEGTNLLQREC